MEFKYSLDKSSTKFICPSCNKKTFVLYRDNETGEYLNPDFGRCDRENECKYNVLPPLETVCYFVPFDKLKDITQKAIVIYQGTKEQIIPKKAVFEYLNKGVYIAEYFIKDPKGKNKKPFILSYSTTDLKSYSDSEVKTINLKVHEPKPQPEPSFHDFDLVNKSLNHYEKNNFVMFLKSIFTADEVNEVCNKYFIGTSKKYPGANIFWQIDNNNKVRHGKIMVVNPETGKRQKNKEGKAFISSVRSVLKLKDFNLNQCLFGLHLINQTDKQTVALVEGEKTAVLMSLFKPEYIWLSTGGKHGFKRDFLQPIKRFKIVAFPDKSEFNKWHDKATELNNIGFKIIVNDWLELNPDYQNGTDLADVYLNELTNFENNEDFKNLQNRINEFRERIQTNTNKINQYNREVNELESECKDLENTFIQASKRCEVKWYAPKFINEPPKANRLRELIYWTS